VEERQDDTTGRVRVHERGGDRAIDGILRLVEEASRERPLPDVLATLCAEIAGIMRAPIASVYLREEDDAGDIVLVMRANVGFPAEAVGRVSLRLGEGITGFVAQNLRPASVAVAETETHYKHVPGLGEEQFPCFAAVPVLVGGTCAGVLVLQRKAGDPFDVAAVALTTAMATFVALALERARARAADGDAARGPAGQSARLSGIGVAAGEAIGRAEPLAGWSTLEARAALRAATSESEAPASTEARVRNAFATLGKDLVRAERRLAPQLAAEAVRALPGLLLVLEDERLVELAVEAANEQGVALGLKRVAREYAFAPYRAGAGGRSGGTGPADAWLTDRAAEIEDLCLLAAARALELRVPGPGAVVMAPERLGAFLTLAAMAHRAAAIVVDAPLPSGPVGTLGAQLAAAAELPVVGDVAGLFAWARAGDPVLVDGTRGVVRINPPASAIARLKSARA
jgi:phosphotransferase system enzyme I (PtsP)